MLTGTELEPSAGEALVRAFFDVADEVGATIDADRDPDAVETLAVSSADDTQAVT